VSVAQGEATSRLPRAGLLVGLGAAGSRILGFVRDVAIAAVLGAGPVADAFLVAFRVPNLVRRVLADGGLNGAFVPLLARIESEKSAVAASRFAAESIVATALFGAAVVAAVILFAPFVVMLLAAGYAGEDERLVLAASYLRLCAPFIGLSLVAALLTALLSARRRFAAVAAVSVAANGVLLAFLAVLAGLALDEARAAIWLACGVGLSGLVQLGAVMAACRPVWPGLARPRWSPDMGWLFALSGPALVANAAPQLIAVAATQLASAIPSAVSWFYYAERLVQLPISFVSLAAGMVVLPEVVARSAGTDARLAMVARAGEAALALSLPAAAAFLVLAEPMAAVLFVRGAFTAGDAAMTAGALKALAVGLPAAALARVFMQAAFAEGEMRVPVVATLGGIVATLGAGLLLGGQPGATGVSLAMSAGLVANAALLLLSPAVRRAATRLEWGRILRLALASALMAVAVAGLATWAGGWLAPGTGSLAGMVTLGAICLAGLGLYGILCLVLGADPRRFLRQ